MFDLLKKIFNSTAQKENNTSSKNSKFDENIEREKIFEEEFSKTNIFKNDKKDLIFKHIKNEINLNESSNLISKEEKEKLELIKNIKLTKEIMDIFITDKITKENPKDLLKEFNLKIFHKLSKLKTLNNMKKAELTKCELQSAGDERTCKWCLDMDYKEIDILKTDIIKLIDDNCTCKYNRSIILVKVDY